MSFFEGNELRKKNPLSVILERTFEDGTVMNSTRESQRDMCMSQDIGHTMGGHGDFDQHFPQNEFSDSEFCSFSQGKNVLDQDEAERLQFMNSKSFSDSETTFGSRTRLNRTGRVPDESMGSYFLKRSSNPIKVSGQFKKTNFETDWADASGLHQVKPCGTSTPKSTHRYSHGHGYPTSHFTNTSAIPFDKSEINSESRRWSNGDENKSLAQSMIESNGSMSSMARFLQGPESVGISKEKLLANVLQYCQARSKFDVSDVSGMSALDIGSFAEFKDNLIVDCESSAASSKSTSSPSPSGCSESDDTIVGPPSPPVKLSTQIPNVLQTEMEYPANDVTVVPTSNSVSSLVKVVQHRSIPTVVKNSVKNTIRIPSQPTLRPHSPPSQLKVARKCANQVKNLGKDTIARPKPRSATPAIDCLSVNKSELSMTPVSKVNLTSESSGKGISEAPYSIPGLPCVVQIHYHYHGDCGCNAGPITSTCSTRNMNQGNSISTSHPTSTPSSSGVITVLHELQVAIENAKKHLQSARSAPSGDGIE